MIPVHNRCSLVPLGAAGVATAFEPSSGLEPSVRGEDEKARRGVRNGEGESVGAMNWRRNGETECVALSLAAWERTPTWRTSRDERRSWLMPKSQSAVQRKGLWERGVRFSVEFEE